MFKKIKNLILGKNYDPNQKTGQFVGTGSHMDDKELESEPNKYEANANVPFEVHPDGGKNTDLNANTIERDIQDWHTDATFSILGQPQTARPQKNAHRDVDAELANKYFSNLERR